MRLPGDASTALTEPGQDFTLEGFLPYRLWVAAESVSRMFAAFYEERFGVSIPEWRVLAVLGDATAATTQSVIERTHMDRVRVSRAVIRLADKGLISRKVQPEDQRAQVLRLSRRGIAVYEQIAAQAQLLQRTLVTTIDPADLAVFTRVVRQIEESAKAADPSA